MDKSGEKGKKGGGGGDGEGSKGKDQARLEGLLPGAKMGEVCTRFPPEPSGYLHIGHAKAALLNNHYARQYAGKLILRFDDTNPSKEKMEFEESIIADLGTLKIFPDMVSHTSDHFEMLQEKMEELIRKGLAYCDDTEVEQMRIERDKGVESKCRSQSVEEAIGHWKEMLKGSEEGLRYCVRGRMNMKNKNKCLRDPVFYRCKTDVPHHRHGNKYKAYPTYDWACPLVDSYEGVSHALRTIEYKDRDEMYEWVQKSTDARKVELVEFSKTQFTHTVLSKRKLAWFVAEGLVSGWDDPRFPTIRGITRRGLTIDALHEFVMTQGMSKATNLMEWDKIWAINKQKIDPVVPRYSAVDKQEAVLLKLSNGPPKPDSKMDKLHPKNDELGERLIHLANQIYLDGEDAQASVEGEQVTLLHWGNCFLDKITRDPAGKVTAIEGRLNLEGSVKDTKRKIHWLANLPEQITPCILRELDHIVTKPKIEDDDKIENIVNNDSMIDTEGLGDPLLKTLSKGDMLQLERRGYYIVDVVASTSDKPMVLVKIPDGKSTKTGIGAKIDASKLQGKDTSKTNGKEAKAAKKEKGKEKAAAAGAAPEEQAALASSAEAAKARAPALDLDHLKKIGVPIWA